MIETLRVECTDKAPTTNHAPISMKLVNEMASIRR